MASEKIDALELDINAKLTTENLDKLITALGRLSKALDNVNAKKVKDDIKDTGDASKEAAAKADLLTNSFLNQAVRITALVAIYRKLSDVISTGIENSMSYVENMNLFTVSLGQYSENASKYADTVRDALGIDPSGWIRTQGVFNTLIEGFGVGAEQAAYMSQNLTQLTYDIASFANISIADAEKKVQSAVAGELEPVRRLGYDLSQNALTAIAQNPKYYGETTYSVNELTGALEANSTALEDNTVRTIANFNELTQGEKVQLRYIALMTQVQEAQGDMARTLNDPANQMRIFKEQLTMTSRALGNVFIPALNQVMPYVTAFFRVVEEGLQRLAAWAGFELPDMSDRMNVSEDVPYYENIVDSTGRAAKNAKKMKDYMIGIDELNVLRPDDGTTGGGGSGSDNPYALGSIYKTPGYDFLGSAITNRVNEAKAQIEGFINYIKGLDPLEIVGYFAWEGLGTIGESFWTSVLGMTPEELAEEASRNGNTIGQQFIKSYSEAIQNSPFGEASQSVVQSLLLGGKTPEELAQEADKNGQTIGEAFLTGMVVNSAPVTHAGAMYSAWEMVFGFDNTLEQRASNAGRTVGQQFVAEFGKQLLDLVSSNPIFEWIYNTSTGRNAQQDLEELEKSLYSKNKRQLTYTKKPNNYFNTSADEARKQGEAALKTITASWENDVYNEFFNKSGEMAEEGGKTMIQSFAKGMNDGKGAINLASSNLYRTAYNGTNSNGSGTKNFGNIGTSFAGSFSSALGSQTSKNNAYNSGYQLSAQGASGIGAYRNGYSNIANDMANLFAGALGSKSALSGSYNSGYNLANEGTWGAYDVNDEFGYIGEMAGQGYVLGIKRYKYEAESAGNTIANATLYRLKEALGIASPSKEAYAVGKFFDEGFANAISDFTTLATDNASNMAEMSLKAMRTTQGMFSGFSVPTNNNAGYGVGAMNESAMMNMASTIYQAVASGISTINLNGDDRDIKVIIDGKEVFKVVQKEQRNRGVAISNGAFSR